MLDTMTPINDAEAEARWQSFKRENERAQVGVLIAAITLILVAVAVGWWILLLVV